MGIFGRKKKDGSKEENKDRKTDDKKGGSSDPENSGEESLKDVRQISMRLQLSQMLYQKVRSHPIVFF